MGVSCKYCFPQGETATKQELQFWIEASKNAFVLFQGPKYYPTLAKYVENPPEEVFFHPKGGGPEMKIVSSGPLMAF